MDGIKCAVCASQRTKKWISKNSCDIYKCKECELGFVHPVPNNLDEIYGQDYFFNPEKNESFGYSDYDNDKEPMRKVFEDFLSNIETRVRGRKIFDYGAATGYFLDIAKQRGWTTAGLEISEYATGEARKRGHDVRTELLESSGKFAVVTMWDVLEHLPSPAKELITVSGSIEKGGFLAINTIDLSSLWARIMGRKWHLIIPPEHLYFFTKKSLRHLLKETGFELLEMKTVGKSFTFSYIFKTLYNWQGIKLWKSLERMTDTSFFRRFSVPINLRDNIYILAQKK